TNAEGAEAWTRDFPVMPARASARDTWVSERPELAAFLAGAEYAHKWQFRPGFGDVVGVFDENAQALVAGNGSVDELIQKTAAAAGDGAGWPWPVGWPPRAAATPPAGEETCRSGQPSAASARAAVAGGRGCSRASAPSDGCSRCRPWSG